MSDFSGLGQAWLISAGLTHVSEVSRWAGWPKMASIPYLEFVWLSARAVETAVPCVSHLPGNQSRLIRMMVTGVQESMQKPRLAAAAVSHPPRFFGQSESQG